MNDDSLNEAIEKTFKELSSIPTVEFKKRMSKHKKGGFYNIIKEVLDSWDIWFESQGIDAASRNYILLQDEFSRLTLKLPNGKEILVPMHKERLFSLSFFNPFFIYAKNLLFRGLTFQVFFIQ